MLVISNSRSFYETLLGKKLGEMSRFRTPTVHLSPTLNQNAFEVDDFR